MFQTEIRKKHFLCSSTKFHHNQITRNVPLIELNNPRHKVKIGL